MISTPVSNSLVYNIGSYHTIQVENKDLKEACKDFEAIFLTYMLQKMRQTIPKSEFLDGGKGEEIFESMQDEAIAQQMAKRGGIGLAEMLYNELSKIRTQEKQFFCR